MRSGCTHFIYLLLKPKWKIAKRQKTEKEISTTTTIPTMAQAEKHFHGVSVWETKKNDGNPW